MSADTAVGRTCPKCGHVRATADHGPAWQCPGCGIAYHKYAAWLERTREAARPLTRDGPDPAASRDGSIGLLTGVNLGAIVAAIALDWDPVSLTLLYGCQSVIIGVLNVARILGPVDLP